MNRFRAHLPVQHGYHRRNGKFQTVGPKTRRQHRAKTMLVPVELLTVRMWSESVFVGEQELRKEA
jgi:hypothetical protein